MSTLKENEIYSLQPIAPGKWEARDSEHGLAVTFSEHQYNETQRVTIEATANGGGITSAAEVPELLARLEYWTRHNYYNVTDPDLYAQRYAMGQRFKRLREARGMSVEELARLAGFSVGNVLRIEAGKFSTGLDHFNRLARPLGARFALITDDGEQW